MFYSVWPHRWQPTRLPCPWDSPGKNTWLSDWITTTFSWLLFLAFCIFSLSFLLSIFSLFLQSSSCSLELKEGFFDQSLFLQTRNRGHGGAFVPGRMLLASITCFLWYFPVLRETEVGQEREWNLDREVNHRLDRELSFRKAKFL